MCQNLQQLFACWVALRLASIYNAASVVSVMVYVTPDDSPRVPDVTHLSVTLAALITRQGQ